MAREKNEKKKIPTPVKRMKQNEKKRLINKAHRSQVRTAINTLKNSLTANNKQIIQEQLSAVYSLMDKGVKKGIYKLNKASRTKARLTALIAKA